MVQQVEQVINKGVSNREVIKKEALRKGVLNKEMQFSKEKQKKKVL